MISGSLKFSHILYSLIPFFFILLWWAEAKQQKKCFCSNTYRPNCIQYELADILFRKRTGDGKRWGNKKISKKPLFEGIPNPDWDILQLKAKYFWKMQNHFSSKNRCSKISSSLVLTKHGLLGLNWPLQYNRKK